MSEPAPLCQLCGGPMVPAHLPEYVYCPHCDRPGGKPA